MEARIIGASTHCTLFNGVVGHWRATPAHIPPTSTTTTMAAHRLSLDEEARLYTTNAERERYGMLATLFGVVVALDYLERAYVRDSVTAAECVLPLPHAVSNVSSG